VAPSARYLVAVARLLSLMPLPQGGGTTTPGPTNDRPVRGRCGGGPTPPRAGAFRQAARSYSWMMPPKDIAAPDRACMSGT
jgi:hypothetical protein